MRVLILALSVLGILVSADAGRAGLSTATRDLSTSVDPAIFADEATQETEDRVGLDKRKRRDVQRRLTGLGFDTKVNGKFDKPTRAVITRWQGHAAIPRLVSSTRSSIRRYRPSPSQRRTPIPAAAITTVRPVVAAGLVRTITAIVAGQVD